MVKMKKPWSQRSRVTISLIAVIAAAVGVLSCHFVLSQRTLNTQRATRTVLAQIGDGRNDLRHTEALTCTPVATTYLPIVTNGSGTVSEPVSLTDVAYWAYQIQAISETGSVDALITSHYDMLVLEPTRTDWSSDDKYFDTRGMVTRLKNSTASDGTHRKLIVAYVDIGEAENWRWYWDFSWPEWDCTGDPPAEWPDYILTCDPDGWAGNYPVAYWDEDWKDIVIYGENTGSHPDRDYNSVLDQVIKDGFDGIYLDWVEAFENTDVITAAQAAGLDPADEMIEFIQEMRDYATPRNPDFIIIQQNAASLIDGCAVTLSNVIDAIAQEAIWYDGEADVDWGDSSGYGQPPARDPAEATSYLDQYLVAGLPVLDCEYALTHAPSAYANAYTEGYVPYVTRRALSQLTTTPPPGLTSTPLSAVSDFLYQLQNLDLNAIGDTGYDLVVMDYSAEGDEETAFTAAQIAALKHSPGGEKIVLAYMSIGEAEDYRFYWQSGWMPGDPAWLDGENPDWPGNHKVRYWDPGWQTIVFSYTDRLLGAGFDGAYLDIIDAYEYYADQGRTTAAQEMTDFVAAIRAHARDRDLDFYIFPQNAPELADEIPAYLNNVDGISQEDIYYGYEGDDVMTPQAVTAELEGYLDLFKSEGKLVLTVDYATTPAHVDDAYTKSQAKGYVPFVTVRDLDQLIVNPGHEPD
ncbi:MAG: MJ1477/TM1410 family putative glycoside hydrolase [Chloroflexota bacterium]|nr:MJ1477/TM1410 family putative glycoside hydrolase [Chloroflexota bacterium]